MLQEEFFKSVIESLNGLDIPYMVTGSMASNFYGQPRLTHDIDFVLMLPRSAVKALEERFPAPRYYMSPEAAGEAIKSAGMFNIVDSDIGLKADFWVLDRGDEYRVISFDRKREVELFGIKAFLASAEDVILTKLDWYRKSGETTQHLRDARAVYEIQRDSLDVGYLRNWAKPLSVDELLAKVIMV